MNRLIGSPVGALGGRQLIWLLLAALALMGLLAACGGDDPTATPTATTPPSDGGGAVDDGDAMDDGAAVDDGDAMDDGAAMDGQVTEEEFFAQDWDFTLSSQRFFSWASVTMKRVIEEHLPNVTLTLVDATITELLVDWERRPEQRTLSIPYAGTPKEWDLFRGGNTSLFPENVPLPEVAPELSWGIYPYSQMQIWTTDASGINSVHDLDGKTIRVGINPESVSNSIHREWYDTAGVKPREIVTTQNGPTGLLEGAYDASTSGIVFQLTTSGDYIPLQTAKVIRMIDFTRDSIEQMAANHPDWDFMVPVVLCDSAMASAMNLNYNVIDPNYRGEGSFEDENCNVAPGGHSVLFSTFPEFPQEAMYQMTKVLVENMADVSALYPGAPWAGDVFAERFGHTTAKQESFSAGAARAFEELGQTYGEEGTQEWYSQRTDPQRWWLDFIQ